MHGGYLLFGVASSSWKGMVMSETLRNILQLVDVDNWTEFGIFLK